MYFFCCCRCRCYLVMLVHWHPELSALLSVCFVRSSARRVFVESVLASIDRKERLEQESLKRRQANAPQRLRMLQFVGALVRVVVRLCHSLQEHEALQEETLGALSSLEQPRLSMVVVIACTSYTVPISEALHCVLVQLAQTTASHVILASLLASSTFSITNMSPRPSFSR